MRAFLILLLFGSLTACEIVDNQRIVHPEDLAVANPPPTARDFVAQNKDHKILVAIIDSGVDYNQSKLTSHIHFTLDEKGQPIGAGYDFAADDAWPAPYIVRTGHYDPVANEDRRNEAVLAVANFAKAAALVPKWATTLLNPIRAIEQEMGSGTYHGTHVAGLASYDNPAIGILPYRVLPRNIVGPGQLDAEDMSIVARQLFAAVDRAAKDGASVINMSLGFSAEKKEDDEFAKIKALNTEWDALVEKYPNILFVAAAGNDGAWIDQSERINFPCGGKHANLLCVGSLADDDAVSDFTNVVLSGAEIVFALGEDVISTFPEMTCATESSGRSISIAKTEEDFASAVDLFKTECEKFSGLAPLSGTSMASPITARLSAMMRVVFPKASPTEIIAKLKEGSTKGTIGTLAISKLAVEKPSWYKSQLPIWNRVQKWKAYVPPGEKK